MNSREKVLEFFNDEKSNWREKAEKGIEQNRKGDAEIKLTDSRGNPLPGAEVEIKQKTHSFKFGVNMFMIDGIETEEKTAKYKKYLADTFNMATIPFYWDAVEPQKGKKRLDSDSPFFYRRPPVDKCLEFCSEHGIEPREHAIAYDQFFPSWLAGASVEEVKREMESHFEELGRRYADKINTIEVTNEMEWNHGKTVFYDEADYVEWCFKTARKYFPHNKLVINEHQWLAWVDRCRSTDKYYSYIEANLLKGAPIDAIGAQYHMFHPREKEYELTREYYNPENLYKHLDMYSRLGKPLQVTEVTIPAYSKDVYDEEIQAEIIENLYTIWFSHPNMEQIVYWNLADGYAHVWTNDLDVIHKAQGDMTLGENVYYGGLLRFDMTPKPAYNRVRELIKNKWHTEVKASTDADGSFDFRGFYGDYDITVTVNGQSYIKQFTLDKTGNNNFIIQC